MRVCAASERSFGFDVLVFCMLESVWWVFLEGYELGYFCKCACVEVSRPAYYYWNHFYLYSSIVVELYGLFERFVDCMYVFYGF